MAKADIRSPATVGRERNEVPNSARMGVWRTQADMSHTPGGRKMVSYLEPAPKLS
jgi:hypothetical protein